MIGTHKGMLLARRASGDELSGPEQESLRQHLTSCLGCQQLERDLEKAETLLRSREPVVDPGPLRPARPDFIGILARLATITAILALAALTGSFLGSIRDGDRTPSQAGTPQVQVPTGSPAVSAPTVPPSLAHTVPTVVPTKSPAASPSRPASSAECGRGSDPTVRSELEVCPDNGRVGTMLTVTGTRCNYPGSPAIIYFGAGGGASTGTYGAKEIGRFETDAAQRFQITFEIPAVLDPIQGQGGGPTQPGTYRVYSKPSVCSVSVRVD